ncbi:adenylate cyclase regulatory protein-like protein [Angomonas deanei]|uniref:Uncharacterized protein n=1 Tax=Angomonas deanei TaxID=59799 RepID=A0A7G2CFY9_9TRYP|nr:adenylate cyclase regulatory protein-like protein [Angomonas deanei]CAD2217082.1 hypothetical protein, conserved [Angomonas deanei]|eukprot:EPY24104.1 adenylate cyclase regulatory protein-like protein [Angomonas deanei]
MSWLSAVALYFNKVPLSLVSSSASARESIEESGYTLPYRVAKEDAVSLQVKEETPDSKFVEVTVNCKEFPKPLLQSLAWWIQRKRTDEGVRRVHLICILRESNEFPTLQGTLAFPRDSSRLPLKSLCVQRPSVVGPIEVQLTELDVASLEHFDMRTSKCVLNLGNILLHATQLKTLKLPVSGEPESVWLRKLTTLEVLHITACDFSILEAIGDLPHLRELEVAVTVKVKEMNKPFRFTTGALENITLRGPFFAALDFLSAAPNLQIVRMNGCDVESLSPLKSCPKIRRIEAQSCERLSSIDDIFKDGDDNRLLASLEELDFTFSPLSDIECIGKCKALKSVRFAQCRKLKYLAPFAGNTSITKLIVIGCSVSDWDTLATCTALRVLHCGGPQLTSAAPFAALTGLTELHFSAAYFDSIEPLSSLVGLRILELSNCGKVSSVAALRSCDQLQEVDLASSGVASLEGLGSCTQLKKVRLSFCRKVTSLLPLKGLREIREIIAVRSGIQSLQGIEECEQMEVLDFTQCKDLASISAVSNMKCLYKLLLGDCQLIKDIKPLVGCTSLQLLNLTNCDHISSCEPLRGLPRLHTVYGKPEFTK